MGSALVTALEAAGHELVAPRRDELDITDAASVAQVAVRQFGAVDWCINCAAYTAVDRAESEPDEAFLLNGIGPSFLARACVMAGCRLLHISTDFVFDGLKASPYTEDDVPNPLSVYGKSKLEGEAAVLESGSAIVLRTSWLFGPGGPCFPQTILRFWAEGKTLRVVSDQVGKPTYTLDLASAMVRLLPFEPAPGIYHAAGPEPLSWFEFAHRIVSAQEAQCPSGRAVEIAAIPTSEYPTPAVRPKNSVLSTAKLEAIGIQPMRPVDEALREFVAASLEP